MRAKGEMGRKSRFSTVKGRIFRSILKLLGVWRLLGGSGTHNPETTTVDRPDSKEMCRMCQRRLASGAK
eukprot:3276694-Amphidinium_carterae.1